MFLSKMRQVVLSDILRMSVDCQHCCRDVTDSSRLLIPDVDFCGGLYSNLHV